MNHWLFKYFANCILPIVTLWFLYVYVCTYSEPVQIFFFRWSYLPIDRVKIINVLLPVTFIFNLGSEHILPVTVHRAAAVPRDQRSSSHRKNRQYTNHFCRCKSKTRHFCDTLDHFRFPCLAGNLLTERGITSIGNLLRASEPSIQQEVGCKKMVYEYLEGYHKQITDVLIWKTILRSISLSTTNAVIQ